MKRYLQAAAALLLCMLSIPLVPLLGSPQDLQENPEDHSKAEISSAQDADKEQQENSEKIPQEETIKVYFHKEDKVKELPMKEYIKSVVCAEMPASFEEEAIKAQAVIAHTYTMHIINAKAENPDESLKGGQISTDPGVHQSYLSPEEIKEKYGKHYAEYWNKISNCTNEVFDEILTYENEPIIAAFHSVSSGRTESAQNVWGREVPYLVSVSSEGDPLSPHYKDEKKLSKKEVTEILQKLYPDLDYQQKEEEWFQIQSNTPSGYVDKITVLGQELTGVQVRSIFDLKSADFSVAYQDGNFLFTTKGYGHGVGLSQYGADYLASQGKNYQEILSHYYPGTTLTSLNY